MLRRGNEAAGHAHSATGASCCSICRRAEYSRAYADCSGTSVSSATSLSIFFGGTQPPEKSFHPLKPISYGART